MTLSPELMKAILSMDTYNRGYDAGVVFGGNPGNNNYSLDANGTKLGSTIITNNSGELEDNSGNADIDQNIGFYALSYTYNGETVISYRGTDDKLGGDLYHGWPLGAGNTNSEQGLMAINFYQAVAEDLDGANPNLQTVNISTTGHSLGGGLAGYVSSLYGKEAVVFDSMAFESAANNAYQESIDYKIDLRNLNTLMDTVGVRVTQQQLDDYIADPNYEILSTTVYNASLKELIYNSQALGDAGTWEVDDSNVSGYRLTGEVLASPFNPWGANPSS